MFYRSLGKEALPYETRDVKQGDELVITFWRTTEAMFVNSVGYRERAFRKLGAKGSHTRWYSPPPTEPSNTVQRVTLPPTIQRAPRLKIDDRDNAALLQLLSNYFTRAVSETEKSRYKLTAAIGGIRLGPIPFPNGRTQRLAGLLYSSMRMNANPDNLALRLWFVDRHLAFAKALHLRVRERSDTEIAIEPLNVAKGVDEEGSLAWLGGVPSWKIPPSSTLKFLATDRSGQRRRLLHFPRWPTMPLCCGGPAHQ